MSDSSKHAYTYVRAKLLEPKRNEKNEKKKSEMEAERNTTFLARIPGEMRNRARTIALPRAPRHDRVYGIYASLFSFAAYALPELLAPSFAIAGFSLVPRPRGSSHERLAAFVNLKNQSSIKVVSKNEIE